MAKKKRGTKGSGSLFYDKSRKRWVFVRKIKNEQTGKVTTKKKTLKVTNKAAAEEEVEKYESLSDIKSKEEYIEKIAEARGVDTTLIKFEDSWSFYKNSGNRRQPSLETLKNYERYWKKFYSWAASNQVYEVEKITPQLASKYMNWLLDESSIKGQSYNKVKNFLKSFYNTLNHGTGRKNPFENISNREIETSQETEKRDISDGELAKILNLADDEMKVLINIGAYTGLRLADASRLKWSEVDLVNREISVVPQKTSRKNKRVIIPFIHSELYEYFELAKSWNKSSEFIVPELSALYNKNRAYLSKKFKGLCEDCGIQTEIENNTGKNVSVVGFHSLRHKFVSEAAKAGVPLFIVQEIVGHGSPSITRHYTHIDKKTISTHMEKLEAPKLKAIEKKDRLLEVLGMVESMNADNWQDVKNEIRKLLEA